MRRQAEALSVDEKPITITLPDGSTRAGIAGKTTPMEIAKGISAGLAKKVITPRCNAKHIFGSNCSGRSSSLKLMTRRGIWNVR